MKSCLAASLDVVMPQLDDARLGAPGLALTICPAGAVICVAVACG
ncbi:MAG TPA: hypothetical protein VNJ52_05240 [Patescibacteria group bacterium]|nr:hypothetical protein [Patescibacteria group bacterium]